MDTKLTLRLDTETIERAKNYARTKKVSLSHLIENYLNFVTTVDEQSSDITPFVKSLSGAVTLPEKYDEKEAYQKHILEKYSK
ncbi:MULTISPECIES: DUF6364 family protein [Dyadobacter]|uniref:DUF6364 family protein n=1 Tax=Dyadobacter TaxID=120831 RepID=UPI0004E27E1C|nr:MULTISPECIES: DUF6364 family protein [Dyadobacter]KQS33407.1 hypothetical protein ASG33_04835 [Dyadobacter sp. Leaf189]